MPNGLQYTSSIKDMPLMFSEMKRTALFLCDGKSSDEIVGLSMSENIYQLEKPKRRRDVPLRMIKRLSIIGQALVEVIAHGNVTDAKLVQGSVLSAPLRQIYHRASENGLSASAPTQIRSGNQAA